ncbi:MAG: hypothetical protein JWR61_3725 [Ferruginibacter sp.]|nr:hypothetical protein [Ferruginibacter sp.]
MSLANVHGYGGGITGKEDQPLPESCKTALGINLKNVTQRSFL